MKSEDSECLLYIWRHYVHDVNLYIELDEVNVKSNDIPQVKMIHSGV